MSGLHHFAIKIYGVTIIYIHDTDLNYALVISEETHI